MSHGFILRILQMSYQILHYQNLKNKEKLAKIFYETEKWLDILECGRCWCAK